MLNGYGAGHEPTNFLTHICLDCNTSYSNLFIKIHILNQDCELLTNNCYKYFLWKPDYEIVTNPTIGCKTILTISPQPCVINGEFPRWLLILFSYKQVDSLKEVNQK